MRFSKLAVSTSLLVLCLGSITYCTDSETGPTKTGITEGYTVLSSEVINESDDPANLKVKTTSALTDEASTEMNESEKEGGSTSSGEAEDGGDGFDVGDGLGDGVGSGDSDGLGDSSEELEQYR